MCTLVPVHYMVHTGTSSSVRFQRGILGPCNSNSINRGKCSPKSRVFYDSHWATLVFAIYGSQLGPFRQGKIITLGYASESSSTLKNLKSDPQMSTVFPASNFQKKQIFGMIGNFIKSDISVGFIHRLGVFVVALLACDP